MRSPRSFPGELPSGNNQVPGGLLAKIQYGTVSQPGKDAPVDKGCTGAYMVTILRPVSSGYTLCNMPSNASKITPIRIENEIHEQLVRDFPKQGFDSLGSYVRSIVEQHAKGYGVLLDLPDNVKFELEKRAKRRGYPSLRDYLHALLESFALTTPDDYESKPARRRRKK